MKILVTGSNGLLGQKIISLAADMGNVELIASSYGANRAQKGTYIYEALDVTVEENVATLLEKYRPEVVINCAAMTNVDASEKEQVKCAKLNVDAVKYLVNSCNQLGIHLVHLSTDFVFDGENGPYSEEDKPNPLSFYGKTKYEAEKFIMENADSYAIIRTIIIYGVAHDMSRSNIVLWAKEALEQGKSIKVVNDQFRSPTLAEDLAKACLQAASLKAQGVYHISGPDFMSILELVKRVADYWQLNKNLIEEIDSSNLQQAAHRPPVTGFNINKAKRVLNYQPRHFEDGLAIVDQQLKAMHR